MLHAESDNARQLITLVYSGNVTAGELRDYLETLKGLIRALDPGFTFLTDLGQLEAMDSSCAPTIAEIMDYANTAGVAQVIRVVPDAKKDIGFMVMSRFHYGRDVRIVTCEKMEDALDALRN